MSRRAWGYVGAVLLAGMVLAGGALMEVGAALPQWPTLAVLVVLATVAQLCKAEAPNHVLFYATPVFFFAGVLLLPPPLLVPLVVVPHLVEWARERWRGSPHLRAWYLQPFNVALFLLAADAARLVGTALTGARLPLLAQPLPLPVVMLTAAATFVAVNHILLGQALVLARGKSWHETGVLDPQTIRTALILLLVGYVVAVLWPLNPWLILPALAPLVLIYEALTIPQLKHEAHVDAKTGVFNARHFQTLYEAEWERAQRFNRPLAVIMADLDRFKGINDTHGHLAGDAVLAAVAQTIRASVRDLDVVGRFGGEEFAIVLPEAGLLEARALAPRIRAAVEDADVAVAASPRPLRVTLSLGVACYPADGTTPADLTHAADVAVYQAKADGRNRVICAADVPRSLAPDQEGIALRAPGLQPVAIFEPTDDAAAQTAVAHPRALGQLLAEGQLQVAFQPIWDLEGQRILAYEALARPAAVYGFTGPQEAFDVAERLGQAHELDALCRQAILARAPDLPDATLLCVNVAPATLERDVVAGTALVAAVTAAGLRPERVVLEIPERAMARSGVIRREAARLRRLGFRLALDDTGVGHAGLELLSQMPLDFVKIDRAVVAQAQSGTGARVVLAGLLAMARETGAYVIAEGIETAEMLHFVRRVGAPETLSARGIHGAQGYLLGRPAEAVTDGLASEGLRALRPRGVSSPVDEGSAPVAAAH